jgi:hypothetical protein
MDESHPVPKFLRPKDVKARYGISVATIYRWLNDEKISGISQHGITLISTESVEAHLKTWRPRGKGK